MKIVKGLVEGKKWNRAEETIDQDTEPPKDPKDKPDQATAPPVLSDIPPQEQHPETPKENSAGPHVTRSGKPVVKPNRLEL